MGATLTVALRSNQPGPTPTDNGRIRETITITGSSSVANDTGTYTSNFVTRPDSLIGEFDATFSGQAVTLTDLVGIGNRVLEAYLEGYA